MHSATIFFTELCICRIIPNLNKSVAKNKQTNKKIIIKTKNPEFSVRLWSLSCGMPVSEVFFRWMPVNERRKQTPFNNRLINRVITQDQLDYKDS